MNTPAGEEPGLEAVNYYDPPNMTFPFGSYVCVVEIDRETGDTEIVQFHAVDDCGERINPMVREQSLVYTVAVNIHCDKYLESSIN
jgi:carbon-monoxide dehydrogenase large subunit